MLERFYPDRYVESAYVIDYEGLYKKGYRGIIFDIDNTLVPHGAPADKRSIALFKRLRAIGFECLLLSNNKEPRVKMFNDAVHVHYIFRAGKPAVKNYERAMDMMGTDDVNTVFVGDQLFTDVWGGKKAGLLTFLVKPIDPREEIQIVLKRYLERIVLHFYLKKLRKEQHLDEKDNPAAGRNISKAQGTPQMRGGPQVRATPQVRGAQKEGGGDND